MDLVDELTWRESVHDATEGLAAHLAAGPVTAYIGFDPTASSLHVGSLVQLMLLARLSRAGHRVVALVGGATGMIGDPSGKSKERNLLHAADVAQNVAALRDQIRRILASDCPDLPIVDNAEWLAATDVVTFLRDVGKHFTVNVMLARESVKRRVESEQGISYTEFSYLVLQAFDYLVLHERFGCTVQMGGSDQWGNIVSGIDLIRAKTGRRVHGFTLPLVTTAAGAKFGKTEEGTVWLDAARTSPYRFYQFWMNTPDADAVRYLKQFTFLSRGEIEALARAQQEAPEKRETQRALAEDVTRRVHGDDGLERARRATAVFFGEEFAAMGADEVQDVFEDVPSSEVPRARLGGEGASVVDLLAESGLAPSKKEARRAIESGGAYVNNRRVAAADARVTAADTIDGRLLVLRKGKKSVHVVRLVD